MKLTDKVLCCCAGGKVRSVGTRYILEDTYYMRNVLAAGLEKHSPETLDMLFNWADIIIVSGEKDLTKHVTHKDKLIHLDIGLDVWGHYGHPKLNEKLKPLVAKLFQ